MAESTREVTTRWSFKVDKTQLKSATESVTSMKKKLQILGGVLAGIQTGIIGFAIKQAGEFEQAQIAFETMLKSTSKAKVLLEDITRFAATTPFELPGLIQSSKKLLAFGFASNEIIDTMTTLGNIASGIGTDKLPSMILAFGKIRTKGKASMEELNILLEAGVPILDQLAKNLGVNTKEIFKMVSAGKIGFPEVQAALTGIGRGAGQFAGLMEKQSKSMFGIFSNIKDTLTILARDIGNDIMPIIKELSRDLLKFLNDNREGFIAFSRSLVVGTKVIIDALGGFAGILKIVQVALFSIIAQQVIANFGRGMNAMRRGLAGLAKGFTRAGFAATLAQIKMLLIPIAIGLAAQDIIGFAQGKKSVLGLLIGGFLKLADILEKEFKFDFLNRILEATRELVELIREFKALTIGGIAKKGGKALFKLGVGVLDAISAPKRGIAGLFGADILSLNQKINQKAAQKEIRKFRQGPESIDPGLLKLFQAQGGGPTTNIKIDIKAIDTIGVGNEVERKLGDMMRKEGKKVSSRPQLQPITETQ